MKETSSRRFSKIEPIVKFSGNLLSFNSILPQNYNRGNNESIIDFIKLTRQEIINLLAHFEFPNIFTIYSK